MGLELALLVKVTLFGDDLINFLEKFACELARAVLGRFIPAFNGCSSIN